MKISSGSQHVNLNTIISKICHHHGINQIGSSCHDDVSGRVLQKGRSNCLPIRRTIEQSWPEPRRLPCSPRRARARLCLSGVRPPVPPSAKFRKRELVPALPDHLRASLPPSARPSALRSPSVCKKQRRVQPTETSEIGDGRAEKKRVFVANRCRGERSKVRGGRGHFEDGFPPRSR